MRTTINILLAAALALPQLASASPDEELRQQSLRVWYHGAEATIAARDLMTARAEMTIAGNEYDKAMYRDRDTKRAAEAAMRYQRALRDEREAQRRLDAEQAALAQAREAFDQIARVEANRKAG